MSKWTYTILDILFFLPFILVFWFGIYKKIFFRKLKFILTSGFVGIIYFLLVDLPATKWKAWEFDYAKTLNIKIGSSVLEELIWIVLVFMAVALMIEIGLQRKNNITIHELRKSDAKVIEFTRNRLADLWKLPIEEIDNTYIQPSFAKGFPYFFVALSENNEFAGNIILAVGEDGFLGIENELWINALFVPEKFRNQGIGRKLIAIEEYTARKHGYKNIYLDTVDGAEYYKKLGQWKEIGKDIWSKTNEEVVIMKKEL